MQFLITRSVANPRLAFSVNGARPVSLPAGTIATLGDGDDPELSKEDEELLKLARNFLELPTPENCARVKKEIEAEELYWKSRMDPEASGGSSFRGFRSYKKKLGDKAQAAQ
jgi:hypothetical protein